MKTLHIIFPLRSSSVTSKTKIFLERKVFQKDAHHSHLSLMRFRVVRTFLSRQAIGGILIVETDHKPVSLKLKCAM